MSTQHPPESPWLPLLKTKRPGFGDWLRANHTWLLSIVAVAVAATAAWSSWRNTIRADARFRSERRPWLTVRMTRDTLAWQVGMYAAVMQVRNVGAGPALWFYGGGTRLDTKQPAATVGGLDPNNLPTRVLPPSDSSYMGWTDVPIDPGSGETWPLYVHYVLFYGGLDAEDTFYLEQVFYVAGMSDPTGGPTARPIHGEERAYAGRVRKGKVVLDGRATPDSVLRDKASMALSDILSQLVPNEFPEGYVPTRSESVAVWVRALRAMKDSTIWAACTESLSRRGFAQEESEFARAFDQTALRASISQPPGVKGLGD